MARPKKYATEAERQEARAASKAAYRQRHAEETLPVNRAAVEDLHLAVEAAAAAGDPVAVKVRTLTTDALLRNLARHFRERAQNPLG